MAIRHEFGGDWTTNKLERLRKYLCAYMRIFAENPRAQHFTTIYVDAFAGTGHRINSQDRQPAVATSPVATDPEAESFKKGSARIALEVEPSFHRFIFIERDAGRVSDLEALRAEFLAKNVQIEQRDANAFLQQWCTRTDWRKNRAVVFLDPYGMQVDWQTLVALAETQAVDLWLLFPLGVAVNRLLTNAGLPPNEWAKALTRIFGTEDWKPAFYPKQQEQTLFGVEEKQRRDATLDAVGNFFLERLKTIFAGVAPNPLPLKNSTQMPIYLLCFAAGNAKGAPTAVRIARHVLEQ